MKPFTYQNRSITTPRGHNVGANVKQDLINAGLYPHIDIKTINSERDPVNRSIVTNVEYTLIP